MRIALLLSILLLLNGAGHGLFERYFEDATMRLDYYHSGAKGEESFSADVVLREGPWAGSRVNLIDTLNLGEYLFRVFDLSTGEVLFSRGYSTMFNEWQTTDEAVAGIRRTFSETVRFPYPKRTVQITIARRDKLMIFHEVFSTTIDPSDRTQVHKERRPPFSVLPLSKSGAPGEIVDIVILGDGYSRADASRFRDDAKHFNHALFLTEPFKSRVKDFNIWAVEVESGESGIDWPDQDIWKDNALGSSYNTFGSARYVLTQDNKAVRDAAACAPYDFICILINDHRYGGGGIYNLYATTYTGEQNQEQSWQMDYVYVHEFGHSFAGLGDEYYTSSTAYNDFYSPGIEPWEPNVTALVGGKVKWQLLLTPGVAIPTPWEKSAYDSVEALRSKLDRLAPDYYEKREPYFRAARGILQTSRFAGVVGAFEGSGYATRGLYRPAIDCRMFSLSLTNFDPVCSDAINRMINFYAK